MTALFRWKGLWRRTALSLAALGLGLWAATARAGSGPQPFHADVEPPYRTQWGKLTVKVDQPAEGRQRCTITDAHGRTRREIQAAFINLVDFPDLDGSHQHRFLRVVTHPRRNTLADIRTYVFTNRGRLRNVLAMPYGFDEARDLDGDGRPELISDDPAPLEWLPSLCHACSPVVPVILRWNGDRYVVANGHYPKFVRARAGKSWNEFLRESRSWSKSDDLHDGRQRVSQAALEYWATLAGLGEEDEAAARIRRQLPIEWGDAVLVDLGEINQRLAGIPATITQDARALLRDGE